jgi:LPS O-antigen subunit length determinant protein (WzzB/FepE family)
MKNAKNLSKEIKKNLKNQEQKSTETLTFRLTVNEKKRIKRLAEACGISQTELIKKLIMGADLKAIPPAEIYEMSQALASIGDMILQYCLNDQSIRSEILTLQQVMNDFVENCKLFYDEGIFGAAYAKCQRDLLAEWGERDPYNCESEAV